MDSSVDSKLESTIDRILFSAQDLRKKLTIIKECGQNDDENNRVLMNHLRDARKINGLQQENVELRQALEDYQYGLEFIMSKYRSQVVELIRLNRIEKNNESSVDQPVNNISPDDKR